VILACALSSGKRIKTQITNQIKCQFRAEAMRSGTRLETNPSLDQIVRTSVELAIELYLERTFVRNKHFHPAS